MLIVLVQSFQQFFICQLELTINCIQTWPYALIALSCGARCDQIQTSRWSANWPIGLMGAMHRYSNLLTGAKGRPIKYQNFIHKYRSKSLDRPYHTAGHAICHIIYLKGTCRGNTVRFTRWLSVTPACIESLVKP